MKTLNHLFKLSAVLLCLGASLACTPPSNNEELEPYYLGGQVGRGIYTTANGSAEVTYHTLEVNGVTYAIYDGDIILGTLPTPAPDMADGLPATAVPTRAEILMNHFGTPGGFAESAAEGVANEMTANEPVTYFDSNLFPSDRRWMGGVIPFERTGTLASWTDYGNWSDINSAMKHIERETGVKFVPRDPANPKHTDYILFDSWAGYIFGNGMKSCDYYTPSGRVGGAQLIVLSWKGCGVKQMVHELAQVIGLQHEHLRSDRDQYINIWRDNVIPIYDATTLFDPLPNSMFENMGSYDFDSVMQWSPYAYSKGFTETGGHYATITPKPEYWDHIETMGTNASLSQGDIESINSLWAEIEFVPQYLYLAANSKIQDYAITSANVPQIFFWLNQNRVMFEAQIGYDDFSTAVPITLWTRVQENCVDLAYLPPQTPEQKAYLYFVAGYKDEQIAFYADLTPTLQNPVPVYQYTNYGKGDTVPSTNPADTQFTSQGYVRSPEPIFYVHAAG